MQDCSASTIDEILRNCRTIAVVEASSNPARLSNQVAGYMKAQGYRVIPNEQIVVEEKAYPSLTAVPGSIDLVDIFRKSRRSCRSSKKPSPLGRRPCECRKAWSTRPLLLAPNRPACSW